LVFSKKNFFFFSYDTEALNKQLLPENSDQYLENNFEESDHKKITHGVQQLYIIGNFSSLISHASYTNLFLCYRSL
jgi:hypothetical protein